MSLEANDVEPGGGLVQDQHGRVVQHGAGDRDALALAARQALAAPVREGSDLESVDKLIDPGLELILRDSVHRSEVAQRFARCQSRVEPRRCGQETEAPTDLERIGGDLHARDFGLARGRCQDRGEDAQGCRFSGPVRSEKAVDLAIAAFEIHALQGDDGTALRIVKDLLETRRTNREFDHRGAPPERSNASTPRGFAAPSARASLPDSLSASQIAMDA